MERVVHSIQPWVYSRTWGSNLLLEKFYEDKCRASWFRRETCIEKHGLRQECSRGRGICKIKTSTRSFQKQFWYLVSIPRAIQVPQPAPTAKEAAQTRKILSYVFTRHWSWWMVRMGICSAGRYPHRASNIQLIAVRPISSIVNGHVLYGPFPEPIRLHPTAWLIRGIVWMLHLQVEKFRSEGPKSFFFDFHNE